MLIDSQSISFNNQISDWQLGDDRIFVRTVTSAFLTSPSEALTDGFFTIKFNPTDTDADALIQKHITQSPQHQGQITGSPAQILNFNIYSADYQGLVSAGTVVFYDMRALTVTGRTITVETGQIQFQQNVTQANIAGVPAVFPNSGQPRFRGFTATKPDTVPINNGLFLTGDFMFNSNPINGAGVGWQCTIGGSPGTWATFNSGSAVIPIGFVFDTHFKGYASGPPGSGAFVAQDWFSNSAPASAAPEGWVCIVSGSPGTWRTKGIIGDS